ncbi:MAG TPA: hypothetical protein VF618_13085 [Thermoanaerobaculia bacterium]
MGRNNPLFGMSLALLIGALVLVVVAAINYSKGSESSITSIVVGFVVASLAVMLMRRSYGR